MISTYMGAKCVMGDFFMSILLPLKTVKSRRLQSAPQQVSKTEELEYTVRRWELWRGHGRRLMSRQYRILLIESDDYSIEILQKYIQLYFPHTDVDQAKPAVSFEILEHNSYDLIVCDAFLRHEERVNFVADLCQEGALLVIITGDSNITADVFSPRLQSCVHDILYKPVDLQALCRTLQCALKRVQARLEQNGERV